MPVISLEFMIFVVITITAYYICPRKFQWCILLASSVSFILANGSFWLLIVFLAMTLCAWAVALLIHKSTSERIKTLLVTVAVIAELTVLILYKDIDFFIGNGNRLFTLFGGSPILTLPDWIAPLGISYYTLILIGYILDVRWGTVSAAQKNPLKFITFAGYFPQIVTGPFTRYSDMSKSLFEGERFRFSNVWNGLQRIAWGLFKIVVISSRVDVLVQTIFDAQLLPLPENQYTGIMVLAGAALYVFYVYMNFSGSMDIVIGISQMLGIPLAENFRRPFTATSLSEVWRKWHLTLGFWLKDYVLYPVLKSGWMSKIRTFCKEKFGKKAAKEIPTYIGMFITWFCVGFWHGGSWKYLCGSGLFFFVMIVGGLLLKPVFQRMIQALHINTESTVWHLFQRIRTFFLFAFSVSFGRAVSLTTGFSMWANLFKGVNLSNTSITEYLGMGLNSLDFVVIGVGLILVTLVSHIQEKHGSVREWMSKKSPVINIVAACLLIASIVLIGGKDTTIVLMYGKF